MAILRSHTPIRGSHELANPSVDRARVALEDRIARACADERAAVEREQAAARKAAEGKVRAAEQERDRVLAGYRQRWEAALGVLDGLGDRIAEVERGALRAAEGEIVRLALAVAAQVLRREVEADPAWVDGVLADLLARVPDRRDCAVRLRPAEAARVREQASELGVASSVRIEDDPALAPGACVVYSGGSSYEGNVGDTWERVAGALRAAAPRAASEGVAIPVDDAAAADEVDAGDGREEAAP